MTIVRKIQFFSIEVVTEQNGQRVTNGDIVGPFSDLKNALVNDCKLLASNETYDVIDVEQTNAHKISGIITKVKKTWMTKVIKQNEKSPSRQLNLGADEFIGDLTYFQVLSLGLDRSGLERYVLATMRDSYGPWYGCLSDFLLRLPVLAGRNIKDVLIKPLIRKDMLGSLNNNRKLYSMSIDIPVLSQVSDDLEALDKNIMHAAKALKKVGGESLSVKITISASKSLKSKGQPPLNISIGLMKRLVNTLARKGQADRLRKLEVKLRDELTEKIFTLDLLEEFVMYPVEFSNNQELLSAEIVHSKISDMFGSKRKEIDKYFALETAE